MNLEVVEQKCVDYLQQVSNPLAPFTALLQHVRENEECASISEKDLLDFLRDHERFKLIEPTGVQTDPDTASELAEAGVPTGPRVILDSRIPTRPELSAMMNQQMARMVDALSKAFEQARETETPETCDKLLDALARAQKLQKNVEKLL